MQSLSLALAGLSATNLEKGLHYYEDGRVAKLNFIENGIVASVKGSRNYHVELVHRGGKWHSICDCPIWNGDNLCKHVVAVVFAAMNPDEGAEDGVRKSAAGSRETSTPALDPRLQMRKAEWGWKPTDRSSALLARLERLQLGGQQRTPDIELAYVLSKSYSSRQAVILAVKQVKRDRDGEPNWSAYVIRSNQRDRLDSLNRRVLAVLTGGADAYSIRANSALHGERQLSPELQRILLPELANAGRLHCVIGKYFETQRLSHDDRGAWQFGLSLTEEDQQVEVHGTLKRGDDIIELARVHLAMESGLAALDNTLAEVDWHGMFNFVELLLEDSPLRFPRSALEDLLRFLARCPESLPLAASSFTQTIEEKPLPVLSLYHPTQERSVVRVRLEFDYGGMRVPKGTMHSFVRAGRLFRLKRDTECEQRASADFEACGGSLYKAPRDGFSGSLPVEGLAAAVRSLSSKGWLVEAEGTRVRSGAHARMTVRSGMDWFDLEAELEFEGPAASLPALLEALEQKSNLVRLSDGSYGMLPEDWLGDWGLLLKAGERREGLLRFSKSRAFLLDALLAERDGVRVDAGFEHWRERLARAREPRAAAQPPELRGELRPYQQEGLGWLNFLGEVGLGGCLADDMGLGKTVQLLAFALARRQRSSGPALVVAPKSLLFNWQRESERFAPALKVLVQHGLRRATQAEQFAGTDLVLTTYGTLLRDVSLLAEVNFDLAVLDEAQAIKNPQSQSAKAARVLRADLRVALTGTPVENRIGDLLSIFEFLNPGLLEGSRVMRRLLEASNELETARFAARALGPFMLRRTKEQVLTDLPAKTEQTVMCELEGTQRSEYDKLRDYYRSTLLARVDELGMDKARMNVLEALLRLRQAACHLALVDAKQSGVASAKLEALLPMLEEVVASGHKALVFSQFTRFLGFVRTGLAERKLEYEYLDGRTRDREAKVERFQSSAEAGVFLISLKAGGVGLNLTGADYVFLLDPWWNPAVERQAIDRAHRIGQTRPVTAYRIVAQDTVEEKVLALQERKRALAEALFSGEGRALKNFTREDLEWVLS